MTCKGWKKSIYGKEYVDSYFTSTFSAQILNNHNEYFYSQESNNKDPYFSGEHLRTFNLMTPTTSMAELASTPSQVFTKKIKTITSTITTSTTRTKANAHSLPSKLKTKPKPKTTSTSITQISTTNRYFQASETSTASIQESKDQKYSMILSSFLEKLRNLEYSPNKSETTAETGTDTIKQNYTILTSSGKKTILVPLEKPRFDLNQTIMERLNYLAEIYSKKINNTKLMNQIEIIKSIFALKNRETTTTISTKIDFTTTRKPITSTTSSSSSSTSSNKHSTTLVTSKVMSPIKNEYMTSEESNEMTKQFDNYFDNLESSTLTVKNDNSKESLDSYYDESLENENDDSLENEDLSILDSDLLLNLQLNTFSTDPNRVNPKIISLTRQDSSERLNGNYDEEDEDSGEGSSSSEIVLNSHTNQDSLRSAAHSFSCLNFFKSFKMFVVFIFVYFRNSFYFF